MQERIRNSPLDIASAEKSGGDGLNELIGSYFERVCGGEPAETVIRGIWISHFKGDIPLDQARNLVGGLFDKLPEEVQKTLEEPLYGAGLNKLMTPMTMAIEEAQKMVEEERRKKALEALQEKREAEAALSSQKKPAENPKRPSKGWRKHTRRLKAQQRRNLVH